MTIDWANFTPWTALLGGALIGIAASLFALFNGRVAGISGLLGSVLQPGSEGRGEKLLFLAGLLLSPLLWWLVAGPVQVQFQSDWLGLILAGLLVGLGTRYAAGCTSGHGVCGLARLSPRSLLATLCFMASGFAVVFVVRHVIGG
ncbi:MULTISPECIES: YeeE/YedE family protein [Pseudomonas]|uniref:YeeE/YedE family protein n=1 Tax=Pseudomonas sp. Hg7Tf TaxID=3236988 RepID=A0AB39I829_9PSED|nr:MULTISPECIES: YeeE/YedE family protein [Pseudomonas]MDD1979066.1 YeeE/YedE family protein [Pseudomonas putida]MDH2561877.1 YeeE/YedE family protein [Pseudomonas sp. Hg5Tf]QYX49013.1 YeeE/YedE family protein [Pseudomonas sp. S11A 273]